MNNTLVVYSLLLLEGVNRRTIFKLYERMGTFEDLDLVMTELKRIMGTKGNKITYNYLNSCVEKARRLMKSADEQNVKVISIFDESYPKRFLLIKDPPVILFIKGNLECINSGVNIAIIGTREPTEHGRKVAARLGKKIAELGCNVISGLAIGCDTYAHRGCLYANGKTVAVMPGGVDKIVPASNKSLANNIINSNGVIISEYQLGVRPFKGNYVDRNRLQSAFSEVVLIVETGVKGGTMHTANFSVEQGKILACYKHPQKHALEAKAQGNIKLIAENDAISIKDEKDIIELVKRANQKRLELNTLVELFQEKRKSKLRVLKSSIGERQTDLFNDYGMFKEDLWE